MKQLKLLCILGALAAVSCQKDEGGFRIVEYDVVIESPSYFYEVTADEQTLRIPISANTSDLATVYDVGPNSICYERTCWDSVSRDGRSIDVKFNANPGYTILHSITVGSAAWCLPSQTYCHRKFYILQQGATGMNVIGAANLKEYLEARYAAVLKNEPFEPAFFVGTILRIDGADVYISDDTGAEVRFNIYENRWSGAGTLAEWRQKFHEGSRCAAYLNGHTGLSYGARWNDGVVGISPSDFLAE